MFIAIDLTRFNHIVCKYMTLLIFETNVQYTVECISVSG